MTFSCLSADLVSSFLLIAMLFVISVSLLMGVVKVRALLGEGEGSQDLGSPSCPPAPLLVTSAGWGNWQLSQLAAEREVGVLGRPSCTLDIITGDPHPFILQTEAEGF